ncbi:IMPACT family protein [Peteryoungia ipomoeae]|uniref:YigZ family protein n=1 Tax=Peteryoungia ipomoeae TaxID=1210932 RepID=A0A4S8P431_9HYPH|nr:YigZ family protein [Peteryoungia ipomoeae]THV24175.1 YigZ family protein [Peteryoungia ipomoeae]
MAFTLAHEVEQVREIKKSRFIAMATPIGSEEEARSFLAARSNPTANHNCWAWRLGQTYRFSDDGEPSGTAGKPILQAIDGQALDAIVVLVTRFFGGILLGSGGLMRAYGGTAAEMLRLAEKREVIPMTSAEAFCSFSDLALVKARLQAVDHLTLSETFEAEGVTLTVSLRQGDEARVAELLRDLTSGRSRLVLPD